VDEQRGGRVGVVPAEQRDPRPHRGQGREDLRARERIAAVGLGLGARARVEHDEIVAALGVAERVDLAASRVVEHERERLVAARDECGRDAGHDEVHVDSERGGRRGGGEPHLLARDQLEAQTEPTARSGDKGLEIPGRGEVGQIFVGEGVVAVVARGASCDPRKQVVAQDV
jgi:hypothetical protein